MTKGKLTGLAAKAIEYRDKVWGSVDHLRQFKAQLLNGGEEYADAAEQCEKIERTFDLLSDQLIDLSVYILKADKQKAHEPTPDHQPHPEPTPEPGEDETGQSGGISPAVDEMERRVNRMQGVQSKK